MSAVVPRKADSHVSGLERARGRESASARERSARADALQVARSDALRALEDPAGLAEWCALAAANLDYSAKVLLELSGQGAAGPCRTRAWIGRNGARIGKGERGLAVSMFGGYVWRLRQTTGRFGSVGSECGDAPAAELDGWTGLAAGDPIAGAILTAMRGYRPAVSEKSVSVERLDRALQRARAVAYAMPGCLSCSGAGCVLCSCLDDKSRIALLDYSAMTPEEPPSEGLSQRRGRGRPRAVRRDIPALRSELERVAVLRSEADRLLAEAREAERSAMRAAVADGKSLADVAAVAGVSKARVQQIVS